MTRMLARFDNISPPAKAGFLSHWEVIQTATLLQRRDRLAGDAVTVLPERINQRRREGFARQFARPLRRNNGLRWALYIPPSSALGDKEIADGHRIEAGRP